MKFKATHEQRIEVEVQEWDVIEATIKIIREKYGLKNVDTIDGDGKMYEHVEYATSHSWIDKEDRGTATEPQKKALEVMKFLQKTRVGDYS